MRAQMGENYRTLLGHFRHELGHYYWDRLIRDDPDWLQRFRAAVRRRARRTTTRRCAATMPTVAPPDWQARHISAYAASHPWEDWAETFAHYLHITDTLEMVHALNFPLGRLDTVQSNALAQGDTAAGSMPAGPAAAPSPEPFHAILDALAGAVGSVELNQPLHGPARPLSVRDLAVRSRASSPSYMS